MAPLAGLIVAAALASTESGVHFWRIVGYPSRAPGRPTQSDRSPDHPESAAHTWINPELGRSPELRKNSQEARKQRDAASEIEAGASLTDPPGIQQWRKTYIDAQD
jgi:hypothetical protein